MYVCMHVVRIAFQRMPAIKFFSLSRLRQRFVICYCYCCCYYSCCSYCCCTSCYTAVVHARFTAGWHGSTRNAVFLCGNAVSWLLKDFSTSFAWLFWFRSFKPSAHFFLCVHYSQNFRRFAARTRILFCSLLIKLYFVCDIVRNAGN